MDHGRSPHTGAQVGGAGGKVAVLGVKGIGERGGDGFLRLPAQSIGARQIQPRQDALDAQMVFLIEHHSQGMGSIEDQGAVGGGDQVGATKVVFHQGGPLQGGKLRHGQKGIPLLHRE